jgi:hypothetical protein
MAPHCVEDERAKALEVESLAMCWQLKDQADPGFLAGGPGQPGPL